MDVERTRITVTVDCDKADTISELAKRMNTNTSRMASMLLEAGLNDHEWIIRIVSSRVMQGLADVLRGKAQPDSELATENLMGQA